MLGIGTNNTTFSTFTACSKSGGGTMKGDICKAGAYYLDGSNYYGTAFILDGTTLYSCGFSGLGATGQNNTTNLTSFTTVKIDTSGNPFNTCSEFYLCGFSGQSVIAKTTNNLVKVWGRNDSSVARTLGTGSISNSLLPTAPKTTTNSEGWQGNQAADWSTKTIKQVFAGGGYHPSSGDMCYFAIIDSNDKLWMSGNNTYGNCGVVATGTPFNHFVLVNSNYGYKKILPYGAPLNNYIMATIGVRLDNSLDCWGYNWGSYNMLPIGNTALNYLSVPQLCLIKA
jgi:hypothetical protein